jgi:hypothetical protein
MEGKRAAPTLTHSQTHTHKESPSSPFVCLCQSIHPLAYLSAAAENEEAKSEGGGDAKTRGDGNGKRVCVCVCVCV